MIQTRLRLCRSLLFLPASNPRAIDKARTLAADMIVLDLEDAVPPQDKARARGMAVEAAAAGFGDRVVTIRVNGPGAWQDEDIEAARASAADFVLLPKVGRATDVADIAEATDKPALAMVETAAGVLAAPAIAREAAALVAGTNDLAADLGIPPGSGRAGLGYALQSIVLAARTAGIAAFDGVHNGLEDIESLARECAEGRGFGFDGKSLIHPAQIDAANRLFGPSADEIDAARRLIAAAAQGAERFEGRMVEALHVDQARALLAKARLAA